MSLRAFNFYGIPSSAIEEFLNFSFAGCTLPSKMDVRCVYDVNNNLIAWHMLGFDFDPRFRSFNWDHSTSNLRVLSEIRWMHISTPVVKEEVDVINKSLNLPSLFASKLGWLTPKVSGVISEASLGSVHLSAIYDDPIPSEAGMARGALTASSWAEAERRFHGEGDTIRTIPTDAQRINREALTRTFRIPEELLNLYPQSRGSQQRGNN